jgi:hypothetical protein
MTRWLSAHLNMTRTVVSSMSRSSLEQPRNSAAPNALSKPRNLFSTYPHRCTLHIAHSQHFMSLMGANDAVFKATEIMLSQYYCFQFFTVVSVATPFVLVCPLCSGKCESHASLSRCWQCEFTYALKKRNLPTFGTVTAAVGYSVRLPVALNDWQSMFPCAV